MRLETSLRSALRRRFKNPKEFLGFSHASPRYEPLCWRKAVLFQPLVVLSKYSSAKTEEYLLVPATGVEPAHDCSY